MIHQLADAVNKPKAYVFCNDATKFDSKTSSLCDGVLESDARDPKDLGRTITIP